MDKKRRKKVTVTFFRKRYAVLTWFMIWKKVKLQTKTRYQRSYSELLQTSNLMVTVGFIGILAEIVWC
ncbi:MAG: hypothetical protein CW691_11870 [Candidatus Bathyarchaeum sp.]|nr:MAG: hypothetical protein CW691_11870 [Candidatus Bathyarchaeum sp.]